jgi:YD repeat-containing protein
VACQRHGLFDVGPGAQYVRDETVSQRVKVTHFFSFGSVDSLRDASRAEVELEHIGGSVGPCPWPDGFLAGSSGQHEPQLRGQVGGEWLNRSPSVLRGFGGQNRGRGRGVEVEGIGHQGGQFRGPEPGPERNSIEQAAGRASKPAKGSFALPSRRQQGRDFFRAKDATTASGSAVASNDVQAATRWPDATTGTASSTQQDTVTVNALGQVVTRTDRNGTTHTYTYDVLGRVVSDAVTVLGSGVDDVVRRVETAYDTRGNIALVTSYDAVTGGSVVTQVEREYNGLGQLSAEWQSASGSVTTLSPKVQYSYDADGQLTQVTYPSGYAVTRSYDGMGRLTSLADAAGVLESYSYLGLGTVVETSRLDADIALSYVQQSGEANGDAGDQYAGLERFGRVVDQRWMRASGDISRYGYGYDRAGNRTVREDRMNAGFSEVYGYDDLNQLAGFDRGAAGGAPTRSQDWSLDTLGNWSGVDVDGVTQSRTHNAQNEVTGVGTASLSYDNNGNLTADETGRQLVYDAWNRLVAVKDSAGATQKVYGYDGLGRRVSETVNSVTRQFVYSAQWQVLEERVAGATTARYVWSQVYVDALVLRDRDTDGNGTLDERLYALQDANYNVVALADASGAVVERYAYDPYGAVKVLTPGYGSRSASSFGWVVLHQGCGTMR